MDFSKMNPAQIDAVKHIKGPCRVIAGAGSGKTTVLTHRIQYMIEEGGVNPASIVGITFTKKAATEMSERLALLIGDEKANEVTLRTFHSFCYGRIIYSYCQWLTKKGLPFKLVNPKYAEKNALLSGDDIPRRVARAVADTGGADLDISSTVDFISWQKNYAVFPGDEPDLGCLDDDVEDEKVKEYCAAYAAYEEQKKLDGVLDMDDMLTISLDILRKDRSFREYIQKRYAYVLVDEFQDTNVVQYYLLKEMMSGLHKNLFIVGDARQSIYGWRGSRVEYILDFEKDWPGAKTIELNDNYRSTVEIVQLSTEIISHSTINYPGLCRAGKGNHGLVAQSFVLPTEKEEAGAIANIILDDIAKDPKLKFENFAVLYRLNSQSTSLLFEFMQRDIPFKIKKSDSFFEKREVRELLAFLSLANDDKDYFSFTLVARMLNNVVSKKMTAEIATPVKAGECGVRDSIRDFDFGLDFDAEDFLRRDFLRALNDIRDYDKDEGHNVRDIFERIMKLFDYQKMLSERYSKIEDAERYVQNLYEGIISFVGNCEKFKTSGELMDYIKNQYENQNKDKSENKVQLLTMHGSKGLEFHTVFIIGMSDGTMPHFRSIKYDDKHNIIMESIEEERRLCYVGITRAMERLYVSRHDEDVKGKKCQPSVFWEELKGSFDDISHVLPEEQSNQGEG